MKQVTKGVLLAWGGGSSVSTDLFPLPLVLGSLCAVMCTAPDAPLCSSGIPCGPAHQVGPVPRAVQQLPHQALLHLQHSHHPPVGLGVKPLRHFPDAVCPL